jgi:hypothetical protein
MRKFTLLLFIVLFIGVSLNAQTSCQTNSGGNGVAEFTNVGQTFTMSGCTGDYLHSIELEQLGNYAPHQITKVEIYSGNSLSAANLLYSSTTVIDLPDTHGELYTITFNDGTCSAGGIDCLQFTNGAQFTMNLTFGNVVSFSGAGIAGNNTNSYAGGAIWLNNSNSFFQIFDLRFDLMTSSSSSLPVELTSFQAKEKSNLVELTWQTATEKNNEGFNIERSLDGKNWESISFVQGNGTTQDVQDYTFIDETPLSGTNYYRLKQIDYDGKFEYSMIETVELAIDEALVAVFPNPVQDEMTIVNGQGFATIFNLLGQPVQQFKINSEQFRIVTTDLPKGQYILHIVQPQEVGSQVVTKRFVK